MHPGAEIAELKEKIAVYEAKTAVYEDRIVSAANPAEMATMMKLLEMKVGELQSLRELLKTLYTIAYPQPQRQHANSPQLASTSVVLQTRGHAKGKEDRKFWPPLPPDVCEHPVA